MDRRKDGNPRITFLLAAVILAIFMLKVAIQAVEYVALAMVFTYASEVIGGALPSFFANTCL